MTTGTGAPRFLPASQAPADDLGRWDARFGLPGISWDAVHALFVEITDVYAAGLFSEAGALAAGVHRATLDGAGLPDWRHVLLPPPDRLAQPDAPGGARAVTGVRPVGFEAYPSR